MNFLTKTTRNTFNRVVEFSDIQRVSNYKLALIDAMIYDPPKHPNGTTNNGKTSAMVIEIRKIEMWLKEATKEFVNDENRKFDN